MNLCTSEIPVDGREPLEGNEHEDADVKRGGLFPVAREGVKGRSNRSNVLEDVCLVKKGRQPTSSGSHGHELVALLCVTARVAFLNPNGHFFNPAHSMGIN